MRVRPLILLLGCFVSIFSLHGQPQPATAPESAQVAVAGVKFTSPRAETGTWIEAEIELAIRASGKSVSGEFVDKVKTTFSAMYEVADGAGGVRNAFYRASAEAITLESGKAFIRFYLPPEVVKRDALRSEAKFYLVDVDVAGKVQPLSRGSFLTAVSSPEAVKNFQGEVNSKALANDGILLPQYLTPFAFDARRPAPSFLRREAQR